MSAPEKLAIHGGEPLRARPFGPRWYFGEEEKRHLAEVIDEASEPADTPDRQRWRSRTKVTAFCSAIAERHGIGFAVPTNSATSAIHTAVAAINPEPGDEVITTPVTDTGGILGIMLQNCIPVFADSDRDTFNIDPDDIDRRITERTRAIIATHLHGNPCDMGAIMEIGRMHGIPVIEDCAQAHLAQYQGQLVGTVGRHWNLVLRRQDADDRRRRHAHDRQRGVRHARLQLRAQGLRERHHVPQLPRPRAGAPSRRGATRPSSARRIP